MGGGNTENITVRNLCLAQSYADRLPYFLYNFVEGVFSQNIFFFIRTGSGMGAGLLVLPYLILLFESNMKNIIYIEYGYVILLYE